MTTLSLLKNKKELEEVNIKPLPIPYLKRFHKDMDWLRDEYIKWSKQFPENNREADEMVLITSGLFWNDCPSKEKLLNLTKLTHLGYYKQEYLAPAIKEKSVPKAKQIVAHLLNVLKTESCDDKFTPGKCVLQFLLGIKGQLNSYQYSQVKEMVSESFSALLNFYCKYWLTKKVIPMEELYDNRRCETFWTVGIFLAEYSIDFAIPDHIRSHQLFKLLVEKSTRYCLAIDDYCMTMAKFKADKSSSRIFCLLNEEKCSLQEAFDNQFEFTIDLYKQCNDLRDEINANPELRSDKMSEWMDAVFNYANVLQYVLFAIQQIYVKEVKGAQHH